MRTPNWLRPPSLWVVIGALFVAGIPTFAAIFPEFVHGYMARKIGFFGLWAVAAAGTIAGAELRASESDKLASLEEEAGQVHAVPSTVGDVEAVLTAGLGRITDVGELAYYELNNDNLVLSWHHGDTNELSNNVDPKLPPFDAALKRRHASAIQGGLAVAAVPVLDQLGRVTGIVAAVPATRGTDALNPVMGALIRLAAALGAVEVER